MPDKEPFQLLTDKLESYFLSELVSLSQGGNVNLRSFAKRLTAGTLDALDTLENELQTNKAPENV